MKITLTQWNQICEALEVAEQVTRDGAKSIREAGDNPRAFRVEGKAKSFKQLRSHILSSDAK